MIHVVLRLVYLSTDSRANSVGRMRERDLSGDDEAAEEPVQNTDRVETTKYPNHVWHVDRTIVPTRSSFCVP